jgi:adenylosuccinate synthase
MCRYLY